MFSNAKYYFNRELSWLKFNQRVLLESIDPNTPLLERLRFIAIASSNLDEFFMIRVAGLRHQVVNGIVKYDAAHMDAKAQLRSTDLTVKEIAFSLGFNNLSFFNKYFRQHTGMTPQEYRRMKIPSST